ncbi:hypothetical protein ABTN49_19845, partial [Acinetobacter baumannii]
GAIWIAAVLSLAACELVGVLAPRRQNNAYWLVETCLFALVLLPALPIYVVLIFVEPSLKRATGHEVPKQDEY